MKRLFSFILFIIMITSQCAFAEPLPHIPFESTQADGTVIMIRGFGDEYFCWFETMDGYVIEYDNITENWYYAVMKNDTLVPGTQVVKNDDIKTSDMLTHEDASELAIKIHGSILLAPNDIDLPIGASAELNAYINAFVPEENYSDYQFVWTCDNPQIISIDIDKSGRNATITAREAGVVTVSVTDNSGKAKNTATCTVSVNNVSSDWEYTVSNGKATIKAYNGNATELQIPSELGGYPVVEIGDGSFYDYYATPDYPTFTTVSIPDSVEVIGLYAFKNCDKLKTVNIGAGVKKIGGSNGFYSTENYDPNDPTPAAPIPNQPAFEGCTNLEAINVDVNNTEFADKDGVLYSKDMSVLMLVPEGKTGSYTVPESVTALDRRGTGQYIDSPFKQCAKLEELILSDNIVGSIGNSQGMDSLKRIYIGKGIDGIDWKILRSPNMQEITVSGDNKNWTSADGVMFSKDKTHLLAFPASTTGEYAVPNTVTSIGEYAFLNSRLSRVILPDTLTQIHPYAFSGCSAEVVYVTDGEATYPIIVAAYDKNGALLSIDYVKAESGTGEHSFGFNVPAQSREISTIKAFVWNSFESMTPLAEAKTINFSN